MATARPRRAKSAVNYALFSATGRKTGPRSSSSASESDIMADHELGQGSSLDEVEDGQLLESPFEVHGEENDEFQSNPGDIDDNDETLEEPERLDEEQSVLSLNDQDLGLDDMWEKQREILKSNEEKREKYRVQLLRKKQLQEALLKQEEDRRQIAAMERTIFDLEKKRSEKSSNSRNSNMAKGRRGLTMGQGHPRDVTSGKNVNKRVPQLQQFNDNDNDNAAEMRGNVPINSRGKPQDRVKMWLASTIDSDWVHETRSEPGDAASSEIQFNFSRSRKLLQAENKQGLTTVKGKRGTTGVQLTRGEGARPKDCIPTKRLGEVSQKPRGYQLETRNEGEWYDNISLPGSIIKEREKLTSGFLDKPRSQVLYKLRWPHMNQNPRYVTSSLLFNQLNFCQLVGGECRTISRSDSEREIFGRLKVLSKIAYLYDQCRDWEKARGAYFAIMSSIEEGEATWESSFAHYDVMCPPRYEEVGVKTEVKSAAPRNRSGQKRDFFCKEFQKGDCNQSAPHKAWIRNSSETVEHFCITCFRAKSGKLPHGSATDDCPNKK